MKNLLYPEGNSQLKFPEVFGIKIVNNCIIFYFYFQLNRIVKILQWILPLSVKMLISKFKIGPDNDHIAIMTFAGDAPVRASLNDPKYHSISGLNELIDDMEQNDVLGSPTRIDIALDVVNKEIFTPENGDRPDSPDILIVFTDGGKHENSDPYSSVLPPLVVRSMRGVIVIVRHFCFLPNF